MKKKSIITLMLALVTMMGLAQTKTATVTGYSPALKDGTLVFAGTSSTITVVDTVQAGHFAYTLPVEEFTESFLSFLGDGCPNSHTLIFLRPDVTVKVTGNDCLNPLWKVESPIPEQQTQNRLTEYCHDVLKERMQMGGKVSWCPDGDLSGITAKKVAEALREGDPLAKKVYEISARHLGAGLSLVIDILNPEMIVIGSIYARNEDVFKPLMEEVIRKEALPLASKVCKIVPAALGEAVGDYAALSIAADIQ